MGCAGLGHKWKSSIESGLYEDLIIICPKPYSTYLRGTIVIVGFHAPRRFSRHCPQSVLKKCEEHFPESRSLYGLPPDGAGRIP